MPILARTINNLNQAIQHLKLDIIPHIWLELIEEGWTIDKTVGHSFTVYSHPWSWFDNGKFYGCVCHADPAHPDATAQIDILVDDQGGGGSYCSHCDTHLEDFDRTTRPDSCPCCHRRFVLGGQIHGLNFGGSDF